MSADEEPHERDVADGFTRFVAGRDAHALPMTDAQRQTINDLTGGAQLLPPDEEAALRLIFADEEPQRPTREHPPEQGRLGDRKPEFRKLSDGVAEANGRSRKYGGMK